MYISKHILKIIILYCISSAHWYKEKNPNADNSESGFNMLRYTCMWKRHNHVPIESSHDYSFRLINSKPKEQSGDFIYIFM